MLSGFAKFAKIQTKARMGRNPATGEAIRIKASKKAGITPLKGFKDIVLGAATAPKLIKASPVKKAAPAKVASKTTVRSAASRTSATRTATAKRTTAAKAPTTRTRTTKTATTRRAPARSTTKR